MAISAPRARIARQVQVHRPLPDGAAPGERHPRLAGARQQGAEHEHRGAHGLDQVVGRLLATQGAGLDEHLLAAPLDLRAEDFEQPRHGVDVAQARDVAHPVLPRDEDGGGEDGQGGVFRPPDTHAPPQTWPPGYRDALQATRRYS